MDTSNVSAEQILELISFERLPLAIALVVIGWVGLAIVTRLLDDLGERFADRRLLFKKVRALLRFAVYVSLTFIVPFSVLKDSGREALIPLFATLGLGLGFAFKDLAASLVSGVLLLMDEPFQVGDRVSFKGYYGEIKDIGLRSVRMVTLDDNLVTIPNSAFLTDAVASANAGELDCMVVLPVYVGAGEDIALARRIIEEAAATSRYVYLEKPVVTVIKDQFLGERFCTVISVKSYVFDARYEKAFETDLTLRIKRALKAAGVRTPDQVYRDLDLLGHEARPRAAAPLPPRA